MATYGDVSWERMIRAVEKVRDAVHILFAKEKVKPSYEIPAADVIESERGENFQLLQFGTTGTNEINFISG